MLKAGKEAAELNAKGKVAKFAAASLGSGAADAVFVADVEEVGTFGDLLGGPTSLSRNEEAGEDATRELLNRVKFGTEGANKEIIMDILNLIKHNYNIYG